MPGVTGTTAGKGDGASSLQWGGQAAAVAGGFCPLLCHSPLCGLMLPTVPWSGSREGAALQLWPSCFSAGSAPNPARGSAHKHKSWHRSSVCRLAGTPWELRGCWSPEHVPCSRGLRGQGLPLIHSYSKIPGGFKRLKTFLKGSKPKGPLLGRLARLFWGDLPNREGWMGWAFHPACPGSLRRAWGSVAGRSCWFHAGARKAFLQQAEERLVRADLEEGARVPPGPCSSASAALRPHCQG